METTKHYYNKSNAANKGIRGKGTRIDDMNATIKDGFQYSSVWSNEIDLIIIWSECTNFHQNLSMHIFYHYFKFFFQKKYRAATAAIFNLRIRSEAKRDWYDLFARYLPSFMLLPHSEQLFQKSNIHINSIALRKLYLYRKKNQNQSISFNNRNFQINKSTI